MNFNSDGERVMRVSSEIENPTIEEKTKLKFAELWNHLDTLNSSRYLALAKTALEESSMWATKGIYDEKYAGILKIKE